MKILFFCTLLVSVGVSIQGCCAPMETIIETREIPIPGIAIHDTAYIYQPVFQPSDCDTGKILELYCKGEAEGKTDGVNWKVLYRNQKDSTGRLRQEIQALINKRDTSLKIQDTTQVVKPTVVTYAWYEILGFAVGMVLLGAFIDSLRKSSR